MIDKETEQILLKAKKYKNEMSIEIAEKILKLFEIYKILYSNGSFKLSYKYFLTDTITLDFYISPFKSGKNSITVYYDGGNKPGMPYHTLILCLETEYIGSGLLEWMEYIAGKFSNKFDEQNLTHINITLDLEIKKILDKSTEYANKGI